MPADMLTKPIVLQREWIKFWHLLGFHVDPEIPKYGEDSPKTKTKNKPAVPSPASGIESTKEKAEENDDDLTVKKVKALVCIAALSTAAMAKCYAADLRLKCANLVLELAKWLVAVWHSPPSNEGSPKEACSNERVGGGRNIKSHWPEESPKSQGTRTGCNKSSKGK